MAIPRNLLQAIEEFYKRALRSYNLIRLAQSAGYSMPDDEEEAGTEEELGVDNLPHFDELMNISHQVDDPGLAQQLSILAELYKRSIQIGGGFGTIVRAINNLKNMYSDGRDSYIESILNGMVAEMSRQARATGGLGKPDNPRFIEQLQQLKQNIEKRDQAKQTEAEDSFQEEMNVPGAQGEGESELTESGLGAGEGESVFDPTAGIGGDKGDKVNRGWHTTGKAGVYKNWAEYYTNEKEAYQADLAIETNPATRKTLQELIVKVGDISAKTREAIELKNQLKVADDPAQQTQLDKLSTEISELLNERRNLKRRISAGQLTKEKQRLEAERNQSRDPREQKLLEKKIELQNLSLSTNVGKAAERNALQALIAAMSGGNFPSDQTLKAMEAKQEEAKKAQITLADYKKKYTEEIQKQFLYKGEVGKSQRAKAIDTDGLIFQFRTSLPNIKMGIKKTITARLEQSENTKYKPYKDAVEVARRNGDTNAEKVARKNLMVVLNQDANNFQEIIDFNSWSQNFYTFVGALAELQKINKSERPPALIKNLIAIAKSLEEQEKKRSVRNTPSKLESALKEIITELESNFIIQKKESIISKYLNKYGGQQ